jgi:CubicO group peptidase (beta-lactamase class C family)
MLSFLSRMDETIQSMQAAWDVPAVSVSIAKDDDVVYARGFGTRIMGQAAPVDEHSIFAIGSLTKAFTAAAIGLLVQERRLGWDDRVLQYLPGFQLYDPQDTREITVRDLLCHRSGLGTFHGDFMGYGSNYTRADLLERVRFIPPAFRLRTGFGYANLMYVAAGEVLTSVTGQTWEDFVQQRLLQPLGMTRSFTRIDQLKDVDNVAQPHEVHHGKLVQIPYLSDAYGPAGAIFSNTADMARWLRFQLNQGRVGDVQLVNNEALAETLTPHVLLPIPSDQQALLPRRHFQTYGLGWSLSDYGGRLVAMHTGGVDGMLSLAAFVPEERLGVTILTNRIPNSLFMALFRFILDEALGFQDRDWQADYLELDRKANERKAKAWQALQDGRLQNTHPSLPLEQYCGAYTNPIYGEVTVTCEEDRLTLHLGAHPGVYGPLEHWHLDSFYTDWSTPSLEQSFVTFNPGLEGNVESLRFKVAEFVDPLEYVFEKKRAPDSSWIAPSSVHST